MNKEKVTKAFCYIGTLFVIIFAFFYMKGCEPIHDPSSKVKSMADQHLIEMYNRKVAEVHSLKGEKNRMNEDLKKIKATELKAVHHYHTVYAQAMKTAPDTCQPYLEAVNQAHMQSDSAKDAHIYKVDSTNAVNDLIIHNYEDITVLKDYWYVQRGDTIQELKVELKQSEKKAKKAERKGILGTIGGAILGFLLGLGIGKL